MFNGRTKLAATSKDPTEVSNLQETDKSDLRGSTVFPAPLGEWPVSSPEERQGVCAPLHSLWLCLPHRLPSRGAATPVDPPKELRVGLLQRLVPDPEKLNSWISLSLYGRASLPPAVQSPEPARLQPQGERSQLTSNTPTLLANFGDLPKSGSEKPEIGSQIKRSNRGLEAARD